MSASMKAIAPERRREFLLGRQGGVGGSDMANILGLTERNALDVYHEKTRPLPEHDDDETVDQMRGLLLEDMAREMYWKHTGRRGRANRGPTTHPDFPAFRCHLDFTIYEDASRAEGIRGTGVGETKSPRSWVLQKIADDGPRQRETIQGLTYCAVSRRDWCGFNYFSLEWNRGPTLAVDVVAVPELGRVLLETGQRFWDDHVLKMVPPDPASFAVVGKEVEEAVRASSGELYTIRDPGAIEVATDIVRTGELAKQATESNKELKDRLLGWIERECPSDRTTVPGVGAFTIVRQDGRATLSRDALDAHRPIDRDKLYHYLTQNVEDEAEVGRLLFEMELDLERFVRRGEPFRFLKATPAKEAR